MVDSRALEAGVLKARGGCRSSGSRQHRQTTNQFPARERAPLEACQKTGNDGIHADLLALERRTSRQVYTTDGLLNAAFTSVAWRGVSAPRSRPKQRVKECAVLPQSTQSTPRILGVFFSAVSAVSAVSGFFTGSSGLRTRGSSPTPRGSFTISGGRTFSGPPMKKP